MTKQKIKLFHNELEETIKKVYKKYGLESKSSRISYDESSLRITLNANILNKDTGKRVVSSVEENMAKEALRNYGKKTINKKIIGSKIEISGKTYTISEYKANRRTYPFVLTDKSGKTYKCGVEAIALSL